MKKTSNGFTLVELMIAMSLGLIILGSVISTFLIQKKTYEVQEQVGEMVQNARSVMDMIVREIRTAGYWDPTGPRTMQRSNPADVSTFVGIPYNSTQLQIVADLRGNNVGDPPDGAVDDENENIIYTFDPANYRIKRNGVTLAENIQSFTFEYLISPGNQTTITTSIRQIRVTITGRTAKPDPGYAPNNGYRTFVLTSLATPKNLAY